MGTPTPIPITAARSRQRPPQTGDAGTGSAGDHTSAEPLRGDLSVLAPRTGRRIVAVRDTTGRGTAA
jgi:hypothetical protein